MLCAGAKPWAAAVNSALNSDPEARTTDPSTAEVGRFRMFTFVSNALEIGLSTFHHNRLRLGKHEEDYVGMRILHL